MKTPTDMADRHAAILTELAELGMSLARHLQARARGADTKSVGDRTLAFDRAARSYRQSVALEARLDRAHRLVLREAQQAAAAAKLIRVQKKRGELRDAVAQLVWTEVKGDKKTYETLVKRVGDLVRKISNDDDFLDIPIEACIARIRINLGFAAAALVENDAEDAETVEVRRSSS